MRFKQLWDKLEAYSYFFIYCETLDESFIEITCDEEMVQEFSFVNIEYDREDFHFRANDEISDLHDFDNHLVFTLLGHEFYLQARVKPEIEI